MKLSKNLRTGQSPVRKTLFVQSLCLSVNVIHSAVDEIRIRFTPIYKLLHPLRSCSCELKLDHSASVFNRGKGNSTKVSSSSTDFFLIKALLSHMTFSYTGFFFCQNISTRMTFSVLQSGSFKDIPPFQIWHWKLFLSFCLHVLQRNNLSGRFLVLHWVVYFC